MVKRHLIVGMIGLLIFSYQMTCAKADQQKDRLFRGCALFVKTGKGEHVEMSKENVFDQAYCYGVLMGMLTMNKADKNFCLPSPITLSDMAQSFLDARRKSDTEEIRGEVLALYALSNKWPCQ